MHNCMGSACVCHRERVRQSTWMALSLSQNIATRDGTIHLPPDSILGCRYDICIAIFFFFFFFKEFQFYKYWHSILLCVAIFFVCFLTLDHGKKLNDTLNIQTVTIKKNLSSYYCDSILQFIVIFLCLLKTRQWKIVDYTLKRDCIWWVIVTKTMHHIFWTLISGAYTYTVYI